MVEENSKFLLIQTKSKKTTEKYYLRLLYKNSSVSVSRKQHEKLRKTRCFIESVPAKEYLRFHTLCVTFLKLL